MSTQTILFLIGVALLCLVVGFFAAVVIKGSKQYHASGILHIKQTEDKDYYTIEITDDLDKIAEKDSIILIIDNSREKQTL